MTAWRTAGYVLPQGRDCIADCKTMVYNHEQRTALIVAKRGGFTMEKFIPYQKLSKKKQRELDRKRRGTWGGLNPVTRIPANSKAYNRQKARRRNREDFPSVPLFFVAQSLFVWD